MQFIKNEFRKFIFILRKNHPLDEGYFQKFERWIVYLLIYLCFIKLLTV